MEQDSKLLDDISKKLDQTLVNQKRMIELEIKKINVMNQIRRDLQLQESKRYEKEVAKDDLLIGRS